MMKTYLWCTALVLSCGGDGVNTPELRQALAGARPPGEAPSRQLAKTPLPMAGASSHTSRDHFELKLRLIDGGAEHVLRVERTIERDAEARFRIHQTRRWTRPAPSGGEPESTTDGRTAVFDGARFASRRGASGWREHETWRGGHHGWLRLAYASGAALVKAYSPLMAIARQGTQRLAGLDAERFTVTRSVGMRLKTLPDSTILALRDNESQWFQWLAATHRADAIRGTLVRRAGSEELLAGDLTIAGTARVEGKEARFTVRWKREVSGGDVALARFELPDTLTPPRRDRPWLMIRSVLRDQLATVYAKRAAK